MASTATHAGVPSLPEDVIITGEAVALELRTASFMARMLAGLLDAAVYGIGAMFLFAGFSVLVPNPNQAQVMTATISTIALVMVVAPTTVETLTRGRSLGKVAAGTRIVRDDGGPIRFRHAVVRALVGVGELWFTVGAVAIVTSILVRRGKRVGDLLAGTYAVRVRSEERRSRPLVMPQELAGWAAGADIRPLPDSLALAARRFLDRTGSMDAASRGLLGQQLAAQIEPYVAPPPPWDTHPERFLAATLVARRDREYMQGVGAGQAVEQVAAELRRLPHGIPDT